MNHRQDEQCLPEYISLGSKITTEADRWLQVGKNLTIHSLFQICVTNLLAHDILVKSLTKVKDIDFIIREINLNKNVE